MDKLICIRHAETTGDVEDRFGGWYDDELSPEGHQQAQALVTELAGEEISVIYCSSLQRTRQVSGYLADYFKCPVLPSDELRERDQSGPVLRGMLKSEGKTKHPELVAMLADYRNTLPNAEAYDDFKKRVGTKFMSIAADNASGAAAVVWHGGNMRTLFRDILELGELETIGDCAWVELNRSENGWSVGRMVRMKRSEPTL